MVGMVTTLSLSRASLVQREGGTVLPDRLKPLGARTSNWMVPLLVPLV